MKMQALVTTLFLAATGSALAAAADVRPLGDAVAALEARYPGRVTAIELDDSGDRPAHYHVDMRFPASGVARLDVDAATLAVATREAGAPGAFGVVHAAARVTNLLPGEVVATAFDGANGAPAHYDVDVALPSGSIARLKVDAATGAIAWRTPPVVADN